MKRYFFSKYSLLIIIAFLCALNNLKSQNKESNNLSQSNPLLSKLKSLRRNANDSALNFADYVIGIAKSNGDKWLESEYSLELARIYFAKDNQIKALELSVYSENISTPKNESYYMAPQFSAFILNRQGKPDIALQFLFKALKRADSAESKMMIASVNLTIADVYRENSGSNKAMGYALKGLHMADAINDTVQLITAYSTLSNILSNSDYRTGERLDSAVFYYKKVMSPPIINRWLKPYDSAKHFCNMGRLYKLKKQFDAAKQYLSIALEVAERKKFNSLKQSIMNEQMAVEMDMGNNQKALEISDASKKILPDNQTSIKRVEELTVRTEEALGETGNYKGAYENLLKTDSIKDSIFNIRKLQSIAEIEKKYEQDTKVLKATNLAQKKENERNLIFILAIFIIAIISAYFIWRVYKRRQQNEFLKTLIHEVNHRTKNNLQMLNSLITSIYQNVTDDTIKSEIKKLRSYIKSFGLVYDNLNKAASFDDVNISEYTEDIGKAVIGNFNENGLAFLYKADSKILISTDKAILIGLIINELITNSLKYAFPAATHNEITINLFRQEENTLRIIYEDNGKGYENNAAKTTSFGLGMIQQLVKQLKGTIIFDTINEKRVSIFIPIL